MAPSAPVADIARGYRDARSGPMTDHEGRGAASGTARGTASETYAALGSRPGGHAVENPFPSL